MEEIDVLLITTLKQAGSDIPDGTEIKDLTSDMLVSAAGSCLKLITGDDTCPTTLPAEMSGRFTACTALAKHMTDNGWDSEIGFQQFLYPEEKVVRQIVNWLAQNLPKPDEEGGRGQDMKGGNAQLMASITGTLGDWKKRAWFPSFNTVESTALSTFPLLSSACDEGAAYTPPYVTAQAPFGRSVAASLMEHNTIEVVRRRLSGGIDGMDVGAGGVAGRSKNALAAIKAGFLTNQYKSEAGQGFDELVAGLKGLQVSPVGLRSAHHLPT
jgi:hypothetical protein